MSRLMRAVTVVSSRSNWQEPYRLHNGGSRRPAPEAGVDGPPPNPTGDVQTALRRHAGIEGGIWQDGADSLAYAFPASRAWV
jgi:hypothetical protein